MPRILLAASRPGWVERLDELHLLMPLRIVAILAIAFVVSAVGGRILQRVLRRTLTFSGGDTARADARQQALASSLKSAILGVVWVVVVITVVGEAGVQISAFVATATVVGGAVAFGAQTLVRDVISGFFVLAEDQYGVGDKVDLGHASGTVERITLRTVRLRDPEGRVWHVPHGNVVRVANLSKSSLAVLDLEVDRGVPIDEVAAAAERIAEELRTDDRFGPLLAEAPRAIGVIDLRDDRTIYRTVVRTMPGRQDEVRRGWRRLAHGAFASGALYAPGKRPAG